ncbi:c1q globular head like domain containing protein [uncultured Mediterranean phage uvMED]|nr:c1q globular head like domain containing protein [uncultured Mediterranean phage uvMED]BAQ89752.1 c1q globular head like domain containing protein [uncultured Mediterranean phage uvMED]BAQ89790.1 c1q globular head like domain containing protein [uncultured Mediterranean phage uvMED]BAR19217.1 c1q globular head like domain containing protein [uncultured Mediterranean phage uvMED]BAR19281.1 c1q globular head like domain containing protein [uncultured Mediterranean phage uvMED]|tara:strand:+ start:346 stop:1125 length:780 start_codon:yes stop_codon:yes gene_type:complete
MGKSKDLATGETRFVNTAGDTMTGDLNVFKSGSSGGGLVPLIKVQNDTNNTTGDGSGIEFHGKYQGGEWGFGKIGGTNSGSNFGGALEFHTNTGTGSVSTGFTKKMTIDRTGAVTTPQQPYIHYTSLDTTTHTGTTVVPRYTSAKATRGTNGYNTSTGTYTAPFTGVYCCEWCYLYMNLSQTSNIDDGYNHNGTHYYSGNRFNAGDYSFNDNYTAVQGGVNIYLAANDTFSPQTFVSGDTSWNFYGNSSWGYLTIAFIG